jgi:glycosyltransferase involved in cell wall biosynthesis
MVSWEYPPMRVGGIAAALEGLAPALARRGVEVHVLTCGASGGEATEKPEPNLHIHRVNVSHSTDNFIHWVHALNGEMEARGTQLLEGWKAAGDPTVLHVHDWLGLWAGRALKYRYHLPLLSTIHATEFGRNSGIHTEIQRYINACEWELQWESWRVVVCSAFMRGEVEYALRTPWDKIDIIYNGVEADKFDFAFDDTARYYFRERFASPDEKIVYFIGRMVREKGAQILVDAFAKLKYRYPNAKLVIAGGGERSHLERMAYDFGIAHAVYFAGRVSDADRDRLYRVADVAVYPSLYEPFGIVALEAMAAHVPVVVSNAGGLPEVVEHDVSGTVTYSGNADSLSWGIERVLREPGHARYMAGNAYARVQTVFNWNVIAEQTEAVYARCLSEWETSGWAKEVWNGLQEKPVTDGTAKKGTARRVAKA